jgi:hypothetical protein
MQALTVSIREYNMRLITTKCLNTAVMFMVLFFGQNALKDTEYCDVHNVVERHESEKDNNIILVNKLQRDVLRNTVNRYVYYVMLTDGYFRNNEGKETFFPGHVMVWEKIPGAKKNEHHYYIYQSYINQYDFSGSLAFHSTPVVSTKTMRYYMKTLCGFMENQVWDENMVKFWKELTNVDTSSMLSSSPKNCFYLCYKRRKNTECLKNLESLAMTTLKRIPQNADNVIYGDVHIYNTKASPLTNREMRESFTHLLKAIKKQLVQARVCLVNGNNRC